MAYYVAKHHVRLPGYTARPGEVFDAALDEDTVQRLLRIGAIEPLPIPKGAGLEDPAEDTQEDHAEDTQEDHAEDTQEDHAGDTQEDHAGDTQDSTETENTPAPEIDVMDGIAPATGDAPMEKPARKSRRSGGNTV